MLEIIPIFALGFGLPSPFIEALCMSQSRECRKFKTLKRDGIVATYIAWAL